MTNKGYLVQIRIIIDHAACLYGGPSQPVFVIEMESVRQRNRPGENKIVTADPKLANLLVETLKAGIRLAGLEDSDIVVFYPDNWQNTLTQDALEMYVIYDRPHDHPGGFVVRRWKVSHGLLIPDLLIGTDLPDLEAARKIIPPGLYNLGRHPDDDSKIVEVWV